METWSEEVYFVPAPAKQNLAGIILSCGIHGDETGPIDVLRRLQTGLHNGTLIPARPLLLVFGNPQAMRQRRRYIDSNLNRLFGAQAASGIEAIRAEQLIEACNQFQSRVASIDLHLDLHSTIKPSYIERFALTPVQSNGYPDCWQAALSQAGFGALVRQTRRANTFCQFTHDQLAADSFTLECGSHQAGAVANNEKLWHWIIKLVSSNRTLSKERSAGDNQSHLEQFIVAEEILRRSDQFRFLLDEQEPNFTWHAAGTAIYQDTDNRLSINGERFSLFLNSKVAVGQRAGLLLKRFQQ